MKYHIKFVYFIDKVWCLHIFIHLLPYLKRTSDMQYGSKPKSSHGNYTLL